MADRAGDGSIERVCGQRRLTRICQHAGSQSSRLDDTGQRGTGKIALHHVVAQAKIPSRIGVSTASKNLTPEPEANTELYE